MGTAALEGMWLKGHPCHLAAFPKGGAFRCSPLAELRALLYVGSAAGQAQGGG